jgi:hypothetical protein
MGEPAFLSEEFVNTAEPDIELVTTSGHGKNGALCILQRYVLVKVKFFVIPYSSENATQQNPIRK